MKIAFARINQIPYPFKLNLDNMLFEGFLQRKSADRLVRVKASMKGVVYRPCDRCGSEMELEIDEKLELFASDGEYKDETHQLSDVMEFFDGQIDLMELAISELELYLSDYFYCQNCKN